MMCARCLKPLKRIHGTAYVQCCSKAYWLEAAPLPRDVWHPITRRRGMCLYSPPPWVVDYGNRRLPV